MKSSRFRSSSQRNHTRKQQSASSENVGFHPIENDLRISRSQREGKVSKREEDQVGRERKKLTLTSGGDDELLLAFSGVPFASLAFRRS